MTQAGKPGFRHLSIPSRPGIGLLSSLLRRRRRSARRGCKAASDGRGRGPGDFFDRPVWDAGAAAATTARRASSAMPRAKHRHAAGLRIASHTRLAQASAPRAARAGQPHYLPVGRRWVLPGASGPGTASRSRSSPASTLIGSIRTASSRRLGVAMERSGLTAVAAKVSWRTLVAAFRKMKRAGTLQAHQPIP